MSAAQIGADDQGVVDIGDLLRILWRGKYIIMVGAIAGLFFGGWFGANKVAPTYTAYAVVVKSAESSPMASLGLDFNLGASGFKSDYQEIIKEQHVLKSRYLMGRVVDTMELVKDPEFNPYAPREEVEEEVGAYTKAKLYVRTLLSSINPFRRASESGEEEAPPPTERDIRDYTITALTGAVVVESIDDSYVFNISATTYDPDKSAAIANAVAGAYIEDQVFSNFQRNEATIKWLSSRVVELKAQLEKAEEAVADFDSKTRLVSEADLAAIISQIEMGAYPQDDVYLVGEFKEQVRIALPFEQKANLADILFNQEVGGFDLETASVSQIYVLRFSQLSGRVTAYHLNARNVGSLMVSTALEMRPNDFVFIAEQPITAWNRVIQQFVPSLFVSVANATSG